jgi:predicted porin
MKKTLLAAALLAGFAGAAHAQSSVTLYGIVDAGLSYNKIGGQNSKLGIDSGNQFQNRLGVRGSEDLGNGLKAIFNLENGFTIDNGQSLQGGRLWGRYAYVGLDSNTMGRLTLGRTVNLQYAWATTAINPFGLGWNNGSVRNTLAYNDYDLNGGQVNNSAYYYTPRIYGFQGAVGYSFANDATVDTEAATGGPSKNSRLMDLGLQYANGPLQVVSTYQYSFAKVDPTLPGNFKNFTIGGNYNFGFMTAYVGYANARNIHHIGGLTNLNGVSGYNSIMNAGTNQTLRKDSVYTFGVSAPVGAAGKALLAYQRAINSRADAVSVGYNYSLSKRTGVYGMYSWGHVGVGSGATTTTSVIDSLQGRVTSQNASVGMYTMF